MTIHASYLPHPRTTTCHLVLTFATMIVQGTLRTGTYTIRNASTNDFVAVQSPAKTATMITSSDDRAENAAVSSGYKSCEGT